VVVDAHAAADPAVRIVALTQPVDLARRANAIDSGPPPQGDQDRRVDGRRATAPSHRLDAPVQRREVQRLHERPDRARRVVVRQQRSQIDRAKLNLVALWRHDSCRTAGLRRLGGRHRARWRLSFTEQTLLGLPTFVSSRRSAHALLNGSGARFVHKF
jgi:hypothetical protein